ncbi:MAG: hypothetical protein KDD94_02125 [Calditrichaeota bacterium]|nr:hypothetical protein [Calditrichota bacterium]
MKQLIYFFTVSLLAAQQFATLDEKSPGTGSQLLSWSAQDTTIYKLITEISGLVYIKNIPLRERVQALQGEKISREEFERLKREIEENHQYRYALNVSLYPINDTDVRLEIERDRNRSNSHNTRRYWGISEDDWDDWDFDVKFNSDREGYGATYLFDGLMINLADDYNDRLQFGYSAEFEHNFYRGFFGLRYEITYPESKLRFGLGLLSQGIFQFNYTNGPDRALATMSRGRWNPNIRLTPQHIMGQLYLDKSIIHGEYITNVSSFRLNFAFQRSESFIADSLLTSNDENLLGYQFEYSLNLLDDNRYPLKGLYFNTKYAYNRMNREAENEPYRTGNKYSNSLINFGSYNWAAFAHLEGLLPIGRSTALQLGAQGIYQQFDVYNKAASDPVNGVFDFDQQKRTMYTVSLGLRKQTDDKSMFSINYGFNNTKLEGFYSPDWNFLEARYYSSTFEIRYTYIFDQKINNASAIPGIREWVHHSNGSFLTVGISLGSLY